MLEMGDHSQKVHADLAGPLLAPASSMFGSPARDGGAERFVPDSVHVEYREKTEDLAAFVLETVAPGDVLMVKSSLGTGFGRSSRPCLTNLPHFPTRGLVLEQGDHFHVVISLATNWHDAKAASASFPIMSH